MNILIIDDTKNICTTIKAILVDDGYENVDYSLTAKDSLEKLNKKSYDIIFLDLWLPDGNGMDILKEIKKYHTLSEVIIITGHGNVEHAVEAIKFGAIDFCEKPLSLERLLITVRHLKEKVRLQKKLKELQFKNINKYKLIGNSEATKKLIKTIEKVASSHAWVLIHGENGTGKEHVARLLHMLSKRADESFIEVNCAGIPEDLIEHEFFGYEEGTFYSSQPKKKGKFELANKGTLFLDEIGDMSLNTQAKLLRVLESMSFSPIGSNKIIESDFRLVVSTHKDLLEEVKKGNFREDLYYRINSIPIFIPPLRNRIEDVEPFIESFVEEACVYNGIPRKTFSNALIDLMKQYKWPGNIRQLKKIVERMVVLSENDFLDENNIPSFLTDKHSSKHRTFNDSILDYEMSLKEAKEQFERMYIINILKENDWNISKSALILNIERTYLHKKIKNYNINKKEDY